MEKLFFFVSREIYLLSTQNKNITEHSRSPSPTRTEESERNYGALISSPGELVNNSSEGDKILDDINLKQRVIQEQINHILRTPLQQLKVVVKKYFDCENGSPTGRRKLKSSFIGLSKDAITILNHSGEAMFKKINNSRGKSAVHRANIPSYLRDFEDEEGDYRGLSAGMRKSIFKIKNLEMSVNVNILTDK